MSTEAANQLTDLLAELNEDTLAKMSDDEVLNLRKQLNPYGRTIEGSDKILTFSYTDLRAEYQKKLMVTSMIGFLNRMVDEWNVPDGIPVVPVYDYVRDPSKLTEFENGLDDKTTIQKDIDLNKAWMAKRVVVKEFLEDMFQYNPDQHVRSAYVPQPLDDERKLLNTPAGHLAINHLKRTSPEFQEDFLKYERFQNAKPAVAQSTDEAKVESAVVSQVREYTTTMIPPADLYHRYNYYYESNYEELRNVVQDLYVEKPDFETAINPYSWHDNDDDADTFINKHKNEVITTIYKAHSGKWNIFSPFKKVRESMRYFNDKTLVLEGIAKQIENDAKLGKDLMQKRIKIKKKKNIGENGPDDAAFLKWKDQNSTLKDMGAENVAIEDDCPDDAIEVPVFRISNGGTKIDRSSFYTQAEAPTWAAAP
jgi:hypothetical protein